MAKPIIEGRTFFQNSGRTNWVRFIPWSALAFAASIFLAALLFFLFTVGFYLVMLVPLLAGLGMAAMVALAVRKGHCRSRLAGGLLGIVTGIIVYLGYFYIGMVHDLGLERAGDIALLPRYIEFRMYTTVIKDVNAPSHDQDDNKPRPDRPYFNWAFFALEFGFIVCIASAGGLRWSQRPYCEQCQDWMKRESTTFKPEVGPGFVEALRLRSVQSLAALFTSPQKPGAPHTAVAVDYCPHLKEGRSKDCPIYMSVKQVNLKGKAASVSMDAFDQSKGKLLVRQTLILPDEVAALLPRFKSLEKISGTTAAEALKDLQVEIKPVAAAPQAVADIRPVDPLFANRILTTKNKLIGNGLVLLLLFAAIGSLALALFGGMTAFPDHPVPGGVSTPAKILGVTMLVLGAVAGLGAALLVLIRPEYFAHRFIKRVALREFARRPNPLVNPRDETASFVQIIPRANWGKLKLDDASDIGFLKIDPTRRELLFEGDNECFRIPGAAINSCEVELFISGQGTHGATKLYRVVLQANHPSGNFWEVPFSIRGNTGKFRAKSREKWSCELQARIRALMSVPVSPA